MEILLNTHIFQGHHMLLVLLQYFCVTYAESYMPLQFANLYLNV